MIGGIDRFVYAFGQATRVGWYFGQYLLTARITRHLAPTPAEPPQNRGGTWAGRRLILAEIRRLLEQDLRNIQAGFYQMPHDLVIRPDRAVADAARYLTDVPAVARRRQARSNAEVFRAPPPGTERLPRYYRQNFHYQTDGYLSERSARLYDHQVEVLFGGAADAMRRQALVPISRYFADHPIAGARLLDVACGTGRFLTFVKDNYPRLTVTALDLSRPYLDEARRALAPWSRTSHAVQAAAEALPVADASQDLVTCIYLFHELPRTVRQAAAREFFRVLKPGGRLVFVDSLQIGDRPEFDSLLERFPVDFHEPYYADFVRQDLKALFGAAGLEQTAETLAFLSKIVTFEKPPARSMPS